MTNVKNWYRVSAESGCCANWLRKNIEIEKNRLKKKTERRFTKILEKKCPAKLRGILIIFNKCNSPPEPPLS